MSRLTFERVRYLLDYNAETGEVSNKVNRGSRGKVGGKPRSIGSHGYLQMTIDGQIYLVHVVIWFWVTGTWPETEIDHWDRVKTNNRWENLRPATSSQNKQNIGVYKNNRLGVRGVTYIENERRYVARITKQGNHHHLGSFSTLEEAAAAYNTAAAVLFGQFKAI